MTPKTPPAECGGSLLPCGICGESLRHVESMALSFTPARKYHEYHHPKNGCPLSERMWPFTDEKKPRLEFIQKWNTRAKPRAESGGPEVSTDSIRAAIKDMMHAVIVHGDGVATVGDIPHEFLQRHFHTLNAVLRRAETPATQPEQDDPEHVERMRNALRVCAQYHREVDPYVELNRRTNIAIEALYGTPPAHLPVMGKTSTAESRETERVERLRREINREIDAHKPQPASDAVERDVQVAIEKIEAAQAKIWGPVKSVVDQATFDELELVEEMLTDALEALRRTESAQASKHNARVTELLEANNALLERAREAEARLSESALDRAWGAP